MTEPKFTRGPWVQCDGFGPSIHGTAVMEASGEAEGNMICSCTGYFGRETAQANAALIAAAPEMFDALHAARDTIKQLYSMRGCEAEGEFEEWIDFIDAALAKAQNPSREGRAG